MPLLIINCFAVHFSSKKENKIGKLNKSLNDQDLEMDIAISQRKFVNKYALLKFSQETEINKNL